MRYIGGKGGEKRTSPPSHTHAWTTRQDQHRDVNHANIHTHATTDGQRKGERIHERCACLHVGCEERVGHIHKQVHPLHMERIKGKCGARCISTKTWTGRSGRIHPSAQGNHGGGLSPNSNKEQTILEHPCPGTGTPPPTHIVPICRWMLGRTRHLPWAKVTFQSTGTAQIQRRVGSRSWNWVRIKSVPCPIPTGGRLPDGNPREDLQSQALGGPKPPPPPPPQPPPPLERLPNPLS